MHQPKILFLVISCLVVSLAVTFSCSANAADLTVQIPNQMTVGEEVQLQGTVSGDRVYKVMFSVDGYDLGTAYPQGGNYSLNYEFTHAGQNRRLVAKACDVWGRELKRVTKRITVAKKTSQTKLNVACPDNIKVDSPVEFKGQAPDGVNKVILSVDGYRIGQAYVQNNQYSVQYSFYRAGENRNLVVNAFDRYGRSITQISKKINVSRETNLSVQVPDQMQVDKQAEFTGTATGEIEKVILSVDGYRIGEAEVNNGKYNLNYSFYKSGSNRRLVVNGFDRWGRSVKQITKQIDVAAKDNAGVELNVPYYYQLNNTYEPYRTCNITCVAMALSYTTRSIDPDTIYQKFGPVFTGHDMRYIADYYGADNSVYHAGGVGKETVKNYLDQGIPVIFQGQFTDSGHIILIVGYDDTGWIVNDPYGEWYYWGYQHTPTAGKHVHYSYELLDRNSLGGGQNYHITAVY